MRCFNLTDVETPELRQRGLVNVPLAVRSVLIPPGEVREVPDDTLARRAVASYVSIGALSVDVLPPAYALRKDRDLKPGKVPEKALRVRRK